MRKAEITFHRDGFSEPVAAVNVKMHRVPEWPDSLLRSVAAGAFGADPATVAEFIAAWRELESDGSGDAIRPFWDAAIEDGWRRLEEHAREIWGSAAEVWAEGRSGGWAVAAPHGRACNLATVGGWDALAVNKRGRFAKCARETCDDIPYLAAWGFYANSFEPARERAREAREELERVRRVSFYYDAPADAPSVASSAPSASADTPASDSPRERSCNIAEPFASPFYVLADGQRVGRRLIGDVLDVPTPATVAEWLNSYADAVRDAREEH